MAIWLERLKKDRPHARSNTLEHRYVWLPSILMFLIFITSIGYAGGSIYWIVKKDNELEKSRRLEVELRNNIKERDYVIQQYRQQIQQLERRVEILDAIQELSANTVSKKDQARIAKQVDETSSKYGHDPFLILALMDTESSIRPGVTSPKGARGLMQLMPSTGKDLSRQIQQSPQIIGVKEDEDFTVPHYRSITGNIELGTLYLTQLMLKYQKLEYAIYAYNLGPTLFEKRLKEGGTLPRKYFTKVLKKYAQITANRRTQDSQIASAYYSNNDFNKLLAQAQFPTKQSN